ncbi:MAG: SIMPL domain-containing protein [Chloroflexota bacterium]
MRTKYLFPTVALAIILVLSACAPAATSSSETTRTMAITGNGTVYLTPDIAYIYIGVHTEDADVAASVDANNAQAQAVVDALQGMGVAANDIQTSNFSVWASQQYDPMTGLMTGVVYMVDNTVYVTVRELDNLGELLNTAIDAGANNINSIQFDVADKTAALAQARQLAVENAGDLAGELAQVSGVELGEIQYIGYSDYYPTPYYGYGMGGGGGGSEMSAPINPGQIQLTVTVSITYAIK